MILYDNIDSIYFQRVPDTKRLCETMSENRKRQKLTK